MFPEEACWFSATILVALHVHVLPGENGVQSLRKPVGWSKMPDLIGFRYSYGTPYCPAAGQDINIEDDQPLILTKLPPLHRCQALSRCAAKRLVPFQQQSEDEGSTSTKQNMPLTL